MHSKKIILIALSLALLGCKENKDINGKILIPEEVSRQVNLSDIVKNVEFLPLMDNRQGFPANSDKVAIYGHYIFIVDRSISKKLYIYDANTGMEVGFPLQFGDGPNEVREVSDFFIFEGKLYVLDGIRRNVMEFTLSEGMEKFTVYRLPFPAARIAKSQDGFYFVTGGGMDEVVYVTDNSFNIVEKHFEKGIAHLSKPINSFHSFMENGEEKALFHSLFDNHIYLLENQTVVPWKQIDFGKGNYFMTNDGQDGYTLDLEGFDAYYSKIEHLNSHFTIFESTGDSYALLYFSGGEPKLAIGDRDTAFNISLRNLKNNVSYEQFIPKISGTYRDNFLATVAVDEINSSSDQFGSSKLAKTIEENPRVNFYLMKFNLSITPKR